MNIKARLARLEEKTEEKPGALPFVPVELFTGGLSKEDVDRYADLFI